MHNETFPRTPVDLDSVSGCGDASRSGQPGFRVRSDFEAELNSDQGWAGALNENVTVYTDEPFRVRF